MPRVTKQKELQMKPIFSARPSRIAMVAVFVAIGVLSNFALFAQKPADRPAQIEYRGTLLVQCRVSDLDKSIAFYRDVLGFELLLRSDALKWAELSFGSDNIKIGIGTGGEVKGSGSVSLNIGVRSVDDARQKLEWRSAA
jgi:hypothetical protein